MKYMSSRPILSRPRTRIYDTNYRAGESYYRPALDRLDRKYSGRPMSPSPPRQRPSYSSPLDERRGLYGDGRAHSYGEAEFDLAESRRRAERTITENNVFDNVRQGGIRRRAMEMLEGGENGLGEETASAIRAIRANKKVSVIDDIDLESTSNALKTHRMLDRSEKILNTVGIGRSDEEVSSVRRRGYRSMEEDDALATSRRRGLRRYDQDDLTRWEPLEDRSSGAAIRALESKKRLEDIEDEMEAMNEKQAARERRVARLKALVAECESETVDDAVEQSLMSVSSTRKEKKSVHF